MRPQMLMAAVAIFLIGTVLSCLVSGVWMIGSGAEEGEVDVIKALASFNVMSVQAGGVWNAPKTLGTYWNAFVTAFSWNYPYLESAWAFPIKFILWLVSIGVLWGVIQVFAAIIQGLVSIVRSFLPGT